MLQMSNESKIRLRSLAREWHALFYGEDDDDDGHDFPSYFIRLSAKGKCCFHFSVAMFIADIYV